MDKDFYSRFLNGDASGGGTTNEKIPNKLRNLGLLIEFLEAKGLRARASRIGEYYRFYERFLSKKCSEEEIRNNILFVMREADEWSWIYKGLVINEPNGTRDLLEKAIGGPAFAKEETENTTARNIQLELRIGSYFLQAGFPVSFETGSDLVVDVDGVPVFVECKRLNSPDQVLKRAKSAVRQLSHRYRTQIGHCNGLVVLDVSRIIYPEQGIASGATAEIVRNGIRAQLRSFDYRFETGPIFSKDDRLVSVWMQAIVPAWQFEEIFLSTRISSLHIIYSKEGSRGWHILNKMKPAFEMV